MDFPNLNTATLTAWRHREEEFAKSIPPTSCFGDRFLSAKAMLKDLYPEVRSARNHSNFLFNSSVTTQIPFSTHLVVDLRPYENDSIFQEHYGVTVSEFVRLQKDGYLIPNFGSDIFRYSGKDYLLPIFQACESHPSNIRSDQVFKLLEPEYEEIFAKLRRDLHSNLGVRWRSSNTELQKYYMNDYDAFEVTWTKRIARVYAICPTLGELLIRSSGERDLLSLVNLLTSVLVFPLTKSVGGIYKTSFTNYDKLRRSIAGAKVDENRVFPYDSDIAEQLCESLNLSLPRGIDVSDLAKYLNDDLVLLANKLMREINNEVERQSPLAKQKAQTLREVWMEMTDMIAKSEARKGRIKEGFKIGISAVVGVTLWAKFNLASILAAVAAREAFKTQIENIAGMAADQVTEMINKKIQPNHTLMFNEWMEASKDTAEKVYLS